MRILPCRFLYDFQNVFMWIIFQQSSGVRKLLFLYEKAKEAQRDCDFPKVSPGTSHFPQMISLWEAEGTSSEMPESEEARGAGCSPLVPRQLVIPARVLSFSASWEQYLLVSLSFLWTAKEFDCLDSRAVVFKLWVMTYEWVIKSIWWVTTRLTRDRGACLFSTLPSITSHCLLELGCSGNQPTRQSQGCCLLILPQRASC